MRTLRFLYAAENREFTFTDISPSQTVLSIKQQIVEKWPTDLPPASKPPDATHVRLLCAGRFLEDAKTLQDVPHISVSDTVTFHVIIMPPPVESNVAPGPATNEKMPSSSAHGDQGSRGGGANSSARCQCVIC